MAILFASCHRLLITTPGGGLVMEFRILGPLLATAGPAEVVLARRERILLALLLLHTNQPVTVERISEAIWADRQPRKAAGQVHGTVYRLRKQLGIAGIPEAVIGTDPAGYRTQIDPLTLDLARFRQLRDQARTTVDAGQPEQAAAQYRAGLQLWRGPALAGIDSDLLRQTAAALDEEHLQARQECLETELELGRAGELVAELTDLVGQHPHREGLHRLLMLALYQAGRQADALAAYRHARQLLHDELGIEPGAELQRLHQAILNRDPELSPDHSQPKPTATTVSPIPRELPADVAGFTGRTDALKSLDELLTAESDSGPAPVVISAIAGTAGVGKTTLAVHWAHRVTERFPDGQLYLNLRGYASEAPVRPIEALHTLLRSLGVKAEEIPADEAQAAGRYRSHLAGRRVLVVLDNASSAEQVRPLLPGSAGCLVLVSSRDRLGGLVARDGARRLTLDVLTPDEAHELLTRLVGDKLVADQPQAAAQLALACAYLPLALRIAAAALLDGPQRPIDEYVAQLRAGDRLAILQIDGDHDSALQATFDLSYRHLPAQARRLFRLLGLVPGADFTDAAVAALAGVNEERAREMLAKLASSHLIEQPVPGRYAFHDLLRLYARKRAEQNDDESIRQGAIYRLVAWYACGADAAASVLYPDDTPLPIPSSDAFPGPTFVEPAEALAWLNAERSNLVAAIMYAADCGPRRMAWLLTQRLLGYFWIQRHSDDELRTITVALAAAEREHDLPAQTAMILGLGRSYAAIGRYSEAIQHLAAATELARKAGSKEDEAVALMRIGGVQVTLGQVEEAAASLAKSLDLVRKMGRHGREAAVLGPLSHLHRQLGELRLAADCCEQQIAIYSRLSSRSKEKLAISLGNLGMIELDLGLLDQAREHADAALDLFRKIGGRFGEAYAIDTLAATHLIAGRLADAYAAARAAVGLAEELGDPRIVAETMNTLGSVHCQLRRPSLAIGCHERSLMEARQRSNPDLEITALLGLATANRKLDNHEAASMYAVHALESAQRIRYRFLEGKALNVLAETRLAQGREEEAREYALTAADNHRGTGHRLGEANALATLGAALHRFGDPQAGAYWRAARELFAAIGAPAPDELADAG